MALDTNFNVNPYYDDFDEDKKYLRLLFKPGYAVQARELTQLQTLLQKQVERFGNHIFQNGSIVTGGQSFFQNAKFLKLESSFGGVAVDIDDFVGKTIVDNISIPTKRAEVIKVYDADAGTGDPKTLLIKEIYGTFSSGETIKTLDTAENTVSATIAGSGTGTGQLFSVDDGVYFYDGFFIKTSPQTVATSKYTTTSNVRVGFEITETIVSSSSDTSLLDPALDASNYQAPGSDRYKIDLVLATRSLQSTDDTQFIEISRIENGEVITLAQYPKYSVLEDTLARRTYDESGNYTVRPFRVVIEESTSNSANMSAVISPGKAYVYGYEFETISPTTLNIPKPRTTTAVTNKRITTDYGYYVFANTVYGTFPINSLGTVDLHCVSNSLINVQSTATVSNTKVGTARVKSIAFDSASNTSNSSTYEYKLFLFDVNVGSITGTVNSAINISTVQIANTLVAANYRASSNNAYTGAKFRITSGPGVGETPKTITNYNWLNQTIELSEPFNATINSSSTWAIDFEFNDAKSLVVINSTTRVAAADIDDRSKDYATPYGDTFISDTSFEPLLFKIGENFIANSTIADVTMSHRRLYESQTFATNQSPALSVGTGESLATGASTSSRQDNYVVVVTAAGTSPYRVGQIIPADLFTVDTATRKITVTNGGNMTANIIATIDAGTPTQKTKTYQAGNTQLQITGGVDLFGNGSVQLFSSNGQIHISANSVVKTPATAQYLFVPDVVSLISILDFNGNQINVANASSATDITSRYVLDNGQRDSFYDHASIKLKAGVPAPKGPLVVKFNKFSSSGAGYFTVDSYNGYDYAKIPAYTSPSGTKYELRDVFDFRPVRSAATAATANSVVFDVDSSTTGPKIPENGSDIILDYSYYLPRNDKIVLNKNRTFEVIQGVPSLAPQIPKDKDGAMTLFTLRSPAYVVNVSNVSIQTENHKRYTMRDIGRIEKRVESLEYYTSLTLAETQALNRQDLTILDSQNVPRAKNGILVDSFVGHSIADVFKLDYKASIDRIDNELRPSFNIASYSLEFDSQNSSGISQNGNFITTTTSLSTLINQPRTSEVVNINPFNVVNFLGKIDLSPSSDVWVDTLRNPTVIINNENNNDVWEQINNTPWEFEWGAWETVWSETESETTRRRRRRRTVTTTTTQQERTGIVTTVVPETVLQSLGDRVLDLSIIPFMRAKTVVFVGSDFSPNTTLYSFFDGISVENYTERANKFTFANNILQFKTTIGDFEQANVRDDLTSTTNATFNIVKTSNNRGYITEVNPTTGFVQNRSSVVGANTGTVATITSYEHYSGLVAGSSSNQITLAIDADLANNISTYNSSVIFIVSGEGAGQSATIQSYDPVTRNVTISGTWTTVPIAANSKYSIGRITTDEAGSIAGVFHIPTSTFRTGEKQFRLIDNNTNDTLSSSTNGDALFIAQGTLRTVQEEILSTIVPKIERTEVTEERTLTDVRVTSRRRRRRAAAASPPPPPVDPIAQTFFVDGLNYPEGIFIDRIRVCFRTKDDTIPVTMQIRPTVNGYPSSSTVFAEVSLTPDKVNVSTTPDLDDATKYTEFTFDQPVYLEPNEYCFVLLANSNKYLTYVAEIGATDLVTGRLISEQPYGGSFFKSQNAYTWTAEQTKDMMFRIIRNTFSTTTGVAQFKLIPPAANVPFDLIRPIIEDVVISNTSITYQFNSTIDGTGALAGYKSFEIDKNYEMTDGSGRRVLTSSPESFAVRASLTTLTPDVSPVIDLDRVSILTIGNIINNLPLKNADVIVSSSGSGYANSSDITVTISGGGGSGATAVANVVANTVDAVYIIDGGSGYTTSPIITLTPGSGGGSGAVVTYNGEDKKSGGNSNVRYITRQVTLADGFDSGDLRVYMNAYKPDGSNILVYYKLLSKSDPELFDDKNYQLMTELGNDNFVSSNPEDYRDLVFAPGSGGEANNSVNYTSGSTSYSTFRTFAIKIVLSGSSTVDVPKVSDLRVIALPAG